MVYEDGHVDAISMGVLGNIPAESKVVWDSVVCLFLVGLTQVRNCHVTHAAKIGEHLSMNF